MQTERVTFLTSRDQKRDLDAFAAKTGMSVGHLVREATSRYMAQQPEEEAELVALIDQVNEAAPKMQATLDKMIATASSVHAEMDAFLRERGIRA